MSSTSNDESRRFVRVEFHALATLVHDGQRLPVGIDDLSLKGATLELPEDITEFSPEQAELHLAIGEDGLEIVMNISVRNREEQRLGVEWVGIDVDSLEHLRRLVELNSGNPEEVRDEIGNLSN